MAGGAVNWDDVDSSEWVNGIRVIKTRGPEDVDDFKPPDAIRSDGSVGGTSIVPTVDPKSGGDTTRIDVEMVTILPPEKRTKANAHLSKAAVSMVAFTSLQPLLHCVIGSKYILQVYDVSSEIRDALLSSVFTTCNYSVVLAGFFALIVFLMTIVDHIPKQTWGVKMPPVFSTVSLLTGFFLNLLLLYHFLYGEGEEGLEAYYLDLSRLVVITTINQSLALMVSGEHATWWLAFTNFATPFSLCFFWLENKCLEISGLFSGDTAFCLITCHLVLMALLSMLAVGLWIAQIITEWTRYKNPHDNKTDYTNAAIKSSIKGSMAIIGGVCINLVYPNLTPFGVITPALIKLTQIIILDAEMLMAILVLCLDILDRRHNTEKTHFTKEWSNDQYAGAWAYRLVWFALAPLGVIYTFMLAANSKKDTCFIRTVRHKIFAAILTWFYMLFAHLLRNIGFGGIYGNVVAHIKTSSDEDSQYFQGVNVFISYVGLILFYLMMRALMHTYDAHHDATNIGVRIMESGGPNYGVLLWPN